MGDDSVHGMRFKGHFVFLREYENESKATFAYRVWYILREGIGSLNNSKKQIDEVIGRSRVEACVAQLGCKY